jgi:hypothetical protein
MANTVIQLKYSTVTATPSALNVAEPAYSYTSNTLFIGSPTGTGAIAIGGKFYLDQQQDIYNSANAAFAAANAAGSSVFVQAAFNTANAAFITANTADDKATSAGIYANGAFAAANSAGSYANSAFATANNEAGVNATQNNSIAAAFAAANSSGSYGNTSFITANAAFEAANSAGVYANGAFVRANNSINANTGGTITGDLSITGNLSVLGNTFSISATTIVANDTVIILGANNYTSDLLDIGFAGHYNDGANAHTGFIRDHGTKEWQLFEGYTPEIGANNDININDPSFKIATLNANVHSTKILIKGIDLLPYVNIAFNTANAAFDSANNINGVNVTQNNSIDAAFTAANSAGVYANGAFVAANTADNKATSAGVYANGAFVAANTAQTHANYAFNHANAAFNQANTDVTNINITGADYGTAAAVPAFRVEANGRISSANSTAIAIDTSAITSGTLGVTRGGTGAGSFTTNGVLLGQGTSAFTTASSATEGHVLTINASGVPTFAHLQGGTF